MIMTAFHDQASYDHPLVSTYASIGARQLQTKQSSLGLIGFSIALTCNAWFDRDQLISLSVLC